MSSLEEKYKPNTNRSRESTEKHDLSPSDKHIRKITTSLEPTVKSKAQEVAGIFIKSDARTVMDDITYHVIIPSIMEMIMEGLHSAVDLFFKGTTSGRRGVSDRYRSDSRVSYRKYYDDKERRGKRYYDDGPSERPSRRRSGHHVDDIILDNRWEAEEILDEMQGEITKHDFVSVADLYEMIDRDWDWTATKWGWDDLGKARIEKLRRGGWELILPEPEKY